MMAVDLSQPVMLLQNMPNNMPNARCVRPGGRLFVSATLLTCFCAFGADSTNQVMATGTFQPDGPPQQPVRVDAGRACVVDLQQTYTVRGTLSGSFDIDFRILVLGPCGHSLGTFDEEWIARGKFVGLLDGRPATAHFTYTANVKSGGDLDGRMVLGQGIDGELRIRGRLSDGVMSYDGQLFAPEHE